MSNFSVSVLFNAIDKLTAPVRKMSKSLGSLSKPVKKLKKDFKDTERSVGKSLKNIGKGMKDIGRSMALKLTLPITAFGGLALRSAKNFQQAMNMVRAVTNASETDFKKLNNLAKELGATTKFSATQAAEAMQFLGMSGLGVQEIFKAMPYVLQLAASAQLDMGTAANISTNIMKGYGMEAKDLAHINDVLVNAFTNANVDLTMLGESFKYAGPIAKGAGVDFETTAALIAKMGDAGIQGTMAGTAMRGMLLRLQNPTKKASTLMKELGVQLQKGNKEEKESARGVFDLVGALKQLEDSGATAAEMAELVGDRAGPGMAVLVDQGIVSIEKFIEKLKEEGTAARVTEMQSRGLPGIFFNLASAFEANQLAVVDSGLGEWFSKIITKITSWLRSIAKLNPKLLATGVVIAGLIDVLGPLLIMFGSLILVIGQITLVWPTLLAGFVAVKAAIIAMSVGFGAAIVAIGPFIAILMSLALIGTTIYNNWSDIKNLWSGMLKDPIEEFKIFLGYLKQIKNILPKSIQKRLGWETEEKYKGISNIQYGSTKKMDDINQTELGAARERIKAFESSIQGRTTENINESKTDINLKVSTDPGTNISIEKVAKKQGDAKVKIATDGYVGQTLGVI